jgi:SAM-dependent methyltransferase
MSRIDDIRNHYAHRISPDRPRHEILDWAGAETQQARFEALLRCADVRDKSLLDVGCGLGDLVGFLAHRGLTVRYTGVDVLEEMLDLARRTHPKERFVLADLFADPSPEALAGETFDVVFCSGALNLNLDNNLEFIGRALPRLWGYAREHLIVNFLHVRLITRDPRYFHYDPADVLAAAENLNGRETTKILDDYLDNDFTLHVRRA